MSDIITVIISKIFGRIGNLIGTSNNILIILLKISTGRNNRR